MQMKARTRTFAFCVLLVGLSCLVLFQQFHAILASNVQYRVAGLTPENALEPLQNANSTTATNQTLTANSTSTSTLVVSTLFTSTTVLTVNQTVTVSYLQYQITSLSEQMSAMSSEMQSLSQSSNMNTVVAEIAVIIGVIAFIAAIAVARRSDAMYRENQPTNPPPEKK